MSNAHKIVQSPVGNLTLIATENGLAAILWEDDKPERVRLDHGRREDNNTVLNETERQLKEYYAGERTEFTVPLDFAGTEFQKKVWKVLLSIPYGETLSYRQVAMRIGNEKAVRAVGTAIGKNPISIIAPCHRVIGTAGDLRGFAGGCDTKQRLLDFEGKNAAEKKPEQGKSKVLVKL